MADDIIPEPGPISIANVGFSSSIQFNSISRASNKINESSAGS